MVTYSISQTAQMLSLSKDALRYYDKIGLLQPSRGENKYRYYTETDLLLLQYVEVMKFGGLSLYQISTIIKNMTEQSEDCRQSTISILKDKGEEIKRKITLYQELEHLLAQATHDVETKSCPADMTQLHAMVKKLYANIGKVG